MGNKLKGIGVDMTNYKLARKCPNLQPTHQLCWLDHVITAKCAMLLLAGLCAYWQLRIPSVVRHSHPTTWCLPYIIHIDVFLQASRLNSILAIVAEGLRSKILHCNSNIILPSGYKEFYATN